ncbi:Hypothetical predicted protein [Octopus vulgaris]|uniref:Uncharacterized protein n=1 Tax=Octopus vulgaris TaxID=6645 RepID=A0AA36EXI1_OCTVU|nr:Hypothetical predicted protein [Octopus vulgaris]
MTTEDVNNLIEAHSDSLMDENLTEMTKSASGEEEEGGGGEVEEEEEEEEVDLSLEQLLALAKATKDLQKMAEDWDPQIDAL